MSSGSKNTSGIGAVWLCGRALRLGSRGRSTESSAAHALTAASRCRDEREAADAAIRAYLKHQADAVAMIFGDWAVGRGRSRQRGVPS